MKMILSFKERFIPHIFICAEVKLLDSPCQPFPQHFQQPKLHSLRDDPQKRWKAEMPIQFWKGSPRNKGSYHFGNGKCVSVQEVEMKWYYSIYNNTPVVHSETLDLYLNIQIDGVQLSESEIYDLCKSDGFEDFEEFAKWFSPKAHDGKRIIKKRLIHWTDKTY